MLLTGACGKAVGQGDLPPLPAGLVDSAENPLGDVANARMTHAGNALRDRIEPQWGHLDSRLYRLPIERCRGFAATVRQGIPAGWQEQALGAAARGMASVAFTRGGRIIIYLWSTGVRRDGCALAILHN